MKYKAELIAIFEQQTDATLAESVVTSSPTAVIVPKEPENRCKWVVLVNNVHR